MSNSEKTMNEFERVLASVAPRETGGNPMQIMYLAGQQSAVQPAVNRIWKFAALVSSTVAAGLLVFVAANQSAQQPIVQSVSKPVTSGDVDVVRNIESQPSQVQRPPRPASSYRHTRTRFDPMQIASAQSLRRPRSIDLFEDFELRPVKTNELKRRYQP